MKTLVESLYSINKASVIHKDIKPENVMFKEDQHIELFFIDFGFSILDSTRSYTVGIDGFTVPQIQSTLDFNYRGTVKQFLKWHDQQLMTTKWTCFHLEFCFI